MQKILILLFILLAMSLVSCTGYNFAVEYNSGPNTNPARDYAVAEKMVGKGGGIYHINTVDGQLGNAVGTTSGKACSHSALYLVAWGDSSFETAKKNAGITKIATAEYEQMGILGFVYHRFCTVITGQ